MASASTSAAAASTLKTATNSFNNEITVTGETIESSTNNTFDYKEVKATESNNSYNNNLTYSGQTKKSEINNTFKY